jgi:hypothetical protein
MEPGEQKPQGQHALHSKLVQLHDELARTESVDENTRAVLADLRNDIQDLLDRPSDQDDQRYNRLSTRLSANLAHFESDHPRLTAAMERAIGALVQMGV